MADIERCPHCGGDNLGREKRPFGAVLCFDCEKTIIAYGRKAWLEYESSMPKASPAPVPPEVVAKVCRDCGRDHAKDKLDWPVGCKVEAIMPIPFYHGRFPAGIRGEVVGHTDDGRPVVKFERDRDTHTFHQPEEMIKWVGGTAPAEAAEVALIEGPMTPRQFAEKWLLDNADSLDYDKRHETEALEQNNTTAGKLAAMIGVAERQAARIAELEKALEPFAAVLPFTMSVLPDTVTVWNSQRNGATVAEITLGNIREAARVRGAK